VKIAMRSENTGGIVAKGNAHLLNDRNVISAPGHSFARRRLSLKRVPGDSERYRAVGLEIVPDAIREFIDTLRVDAKRRVSIAR